jgi:hypothetical protein
MRNLYERWGTVLNPDMRMACGSSTCAYCHESQMNAIWNRYNNGTVAHVADAFIGGLQVGVVVPLCITMGGSNVTATPLYDTAFTNQPNTSGSTHYHIQYLSHFASTPRVLQLREIEIPRLLPILKVIPLPLPERLRDMEFKREGDFQISADEVADRGPQVRVNELSGAVYVLGELKLDVEEPALEEKEYIERALHYIDEQGWTEESYSEPLGARFMITMVPVEGEKNEPQEFQKNVIVTFKRQIDVEGVPVHVLGEGGVMTVQMNNDGSVLNASKVWRSVVSTEQQVPIKTYEEAYEEALGQLENPRAYDLDRWIWGYKEAAGNVEQTELQIVFQFWFVPTDPDTPVEYPPQMIEIPGQSK